MKLLYCRISTNSLQLVTITSVLEAEVSNTGEERSAEIPIPGIGSNAVRYG